MKGGGGHCVQGRPGEPRTRVKHQGACSGALRGGGRARARLRLRVGKSPGPAGSPSPTPLAPAPRCRGGAPRLHSDDCSGGSVPGGRAAPRGTMAAPRTPQGADTSRHHRQAAMALMLARAPPTVRACARPARWRSVAVKNSVWGPFLRYKRAR